MRQSVSVGIVTALVCFGVWACTFRQEPAERPIPRLRIGTALPKTEMTAAGIRAVVEGLFAEPLLSVAWDGRIVPRICESWEWLRGDLGLRLTLRSDVRFHDGTLLTADILANIIRQNASNGEGLTYRSIAAVEAVDPRTVEIQLRQPEGFLPSEIADFRIKLGPSNGTGPFMLDAHAGDNQTVLRRFDQYYQGTPAIETVEVRGYPTLRNAWTALMRSEINMLYEVSRETVDFVEAEPIVENYPFTRAYYYLLAFNMRHPVLGRRDVRQALSQAIDRQAIVNEGMNGRGETADGPVWKYHWAYSTVQRTYEYNPEAARLRLDAAGLVNRQSSDPKAMPGRFHFTALMFGEDPRFERVGLVLQRQLYEMGVDMQIEALSLVDLAERMQAGRFDAVLIEMNSGRTMNWPYSVWHSRATTPLGLFDSGYRSADAVLDRLRWAISDAEIRSAVSGVQQVLYEDPPALFLAWPQTSRAVSAAIDVPDAQVPAKPGADILGRLWQWRPSRSEMARR